MTIRRAVPDVKTLSPEKSRRFYTEVLGFDLAMDLGWVQTFVSRTNAVVQINVLAADAAAPVVPSVSVEVADVDAVHTLALEHGLEIVYPLTNEPWGVRRFFVRDPGGEAIINVLSHRA